MSAAWQILKEDKNLLLLPASFAVPAVIGALTGAPVSHDRDQIESLSYIGMLLFYIAAHGIAIFFNVALAICVLQKLAGKPATILDGLREGLSCFPQILGWAVVSATIGLLLKAMGRRSGFVGGLVAKDGGLDLECRHPPFPACIGG